MADFLQPALDHFARCHASEATLACIPHQAIPKQFQGLQTLDGRLICSISAGVLIVGPYPLVLGSQAE